MLLFQWKRAVYALLFFKDIGVPDSQTVNSSSMAFHKFKTKPPFHSYTLKTYYSKNVFVECSVFEFLASYFHFSRLFKLNKFSISVTVLLLSVHPSNSLDVFNSSFCLLFGLVMMWFFRHNMLHTMILNLKSKQRLKFRAKHWLTCALIFYFFF